jgi:hypothetical protein
MSRIARVIDRNTRCVSPVSAFQLQKEDKQKGTFKWRTEESEKRKRNVYVRFLVLRWHETHTLWRGWCSWSNNSHTYLSEQLFMPYSCTRIKSEVNLKSSSVKRSHEHVLHTLDEVLECLFSQRHSNRGNKTDSTQNQQRIDRTHDKLFNEEWSESLKKYNEWSQTTNSMFWKEDCRNKNKRNISRRLCTYLTGTFTRRLHKNIDCLYWIVCVFEDEFPLGFRVFVFSLFSNETTVVNACSGIRVSRKIQSPRFSHPMKLNGWDII